MNSVDLRILFAMILGLGCALANRVSLAEPYIEHLEPSAVARGQRNRLTIVGTDVDRPIGLWTSLPPGKMKVGSGKSNGSSRTEFEIEVTNDCPLGLYGLRLATEDGLSNLCLFLVDDLFPSTALASPHKSFPVAVPGELRPAAADRYSIEVAAGQKLAFDIVSNRFGTDADPLITIFDSTGRRVVQRDNDPGLFFDCCFEHTFEMAGIYTVEVRDARFQGSPHWRYVLRMGNFPAARVAIPSAVLPGEKTTLRFPELADDTIHFETPSNLPPGGFFYSLRRPGDNASNWIPLLSTDLRNVVEAEPNDLPEQATTAGESPVVLHGTLNPPGDKDQFLFDLKQGEKLVFRAETRPLELGGRRRTRPFRSRRQGSATERRCNFSRWCRGRSDNHLRCSQSGPIPAAGSRSNRPGWTAIHVSCASSPECAAFSTFVCRCRLRHPSTVIPAFANDRRADRLCRTD